MTAAGKRTVVARLFLLGGAGVIGFAILLVVIGARLGYWTTPIPGESSSNAVAAPPVAPTRVSATALFAAYSSDEALADATFKGKAVEVDGIVSDVTRDSLGAPIVQFAAGAVPSYQYVEAAFEPDHAPAVAALAKGAHARAVCTVIGRSAIGLRVQANHCVLRAP